MSKLFFVLGNQLFHPSYFKEFKDHHFFLAEDYELCTYEKHHKQKIIFFLSSMRSFRDEIKKVGLNVTYLDIKDKKFKKNYTEKLLDFIKVKKINEVNFFEIEDKFLEKKI